MRYHLVAVLVAACRTEPPIAHQATPVASGCIPPAAPADVVIQVSRSRLPIGGNRTEERGAVTRGGVCPSKVACRQVDGTTMAKIWSTLARAATIDHGPPSSPHYGGRWIEATWSGGSCAIADDQQTPVTSESAPRFDAAFDAIVGTFH